MKKGICLLLPLFLLISHPLMAGPGNPLKTLIKKSAKPTAVQTSRQILTQYQLNLGVLEAAQRNYDQQIAGILASSSMSDAKKLAKINALTEKTSPFLASLLEEDARLFSQYGKALLKERDPKFLPPEKIMPQIPELFSSTERVEVLSNPNTVSPRFFREWARLLEHDVDVPPEIEAMLTTLGSNLETAEIIFNRELFKQRVAREKLQTDRDNLAKHIEEIFNSQMRLARLSEKSAHDVTDMVFLCNLYPSIYEESLMNLASQIDILQTQTPFTTFIRQQLNVPERIRVRGFMGNDPFGGPQPMRPTERRAIGFQSPSIQPPEPIEVDE